MKLSHTNGLLYLVQVHVHSDMKLLNVHPFHLYHEPQE